MVNQTEALARFNKEKEYEDKLAADLCDHFISSLDSISDLGTEEKQKAKESLDFISKESRKHSHMFNMLIQMLVENGDNNY